MAVEKEHQLKVLQAWIDLKFKVAGYVLLANGAALATSVAFLKEKGPEIEGMHGLSTASLGLLSGALAVLVASAFSTAVLSNQFEGERKIPEKKKPDPEWAKKVEAFFCSMRGANLAFNIFVVASALSLMVSLAFLSGVMEARRDFYEKNPGARELIEKHKKGLL